MQWAQYNQRLPAPGLRRGDGYFEIFAIFDTL
jgi:hypothetical protein